MLPIIFLDRSMVKDYREENLAVLSLIKFFISKHSMSLRCKQEVDFKSIVFKDFSELNLEYKGIRGSLMLSTISLKYNL